MYYTLKSSLRDNNIEEFKKLLQHIDSVPLEIENEIISGQKKEFLHLLIERDLLSDFAKELSGCFDNKNALIYKIKKCC